MTASSQPKTPEDNELDAAVDDAIAACNGDLRATIRALIVANNFLECEGGLARLCARTISRLFRLTRDAASAKARRRLKSPNADA